MATLASLTGDYSNAAWTKNAGFAANATDSKRLDITISGSTNLCDTPSNYDLTASSFTWKNQWIPPYNSTDLAQSQLSLEFRDNGTSGTGYRILRSATTGAWQFQKAGTIVGSTWTDLNARANPFWRIREASGTTYFEYSADGSSWAEPDGTQHTANYSTITAIKPRWQPSAVADAGRWSVQQTNGAAAPTISNDPTIFYMQSTVTAANAAVDADPAAPTVATGDLSLLIVQIKASLIAVAPTITTPSGWTLIGTVTNNGTLAAGGDTGSNTIGMYYRTDSGYSAPNIQSVNADSMSSAIVVFRSSKVAAGGSWDVANSTTGSDTTSGANISITGGGSIGVSAGDMVLAVASASGDAGAPSALTIGGMSGATLMQDNTPIARDVSTGLDSCEIITYNYVISGSSTSAPTFTYTNASSTTAHGMFLRIRDVAGSSVQTISVTAATETDAAIAVTPVKVIRKAVTAATETDTVLSVSAKKIVHVVAVTETDTLQNVTPVKLIRKAVTAATEADAAQTVSPVKHQYVSVAAASESNAAQSVTPRLIVHVIPALPPSLPPLFDTQSDFAMDVAPHKTAQVVGVTETDAAQAVTPVKPIFVVVAAATESDTAQTVAPSKTVVVTGVVESDAAQSVAPRVTVHVTAASESDAAQTVLPVKRQYVTVDAATETDAVGAIVPYKTATIGTATESDSSVAVTVKLGNDQSVSIDSVFEVDTAQTVVPVKPVSLEVTSTSETDTAQTITPRLVVQVQTVQEADSAGSVAPRKIAHVSAATEADASQSVTPVKPIVVTMGSAVETDTARTITPVKPQIVSIGTVFEVDTALLALPVKTQYVTVGTATDTSISIAITPRKHTPVGVVLETDVAQPVRARISTPTHNVGHVSIKTGRTSVTASGRTGVVVGTPGRTGVTVHR